VSKRPCPNQVVAALRAQFYDSATAPVIEACVERNERRIKAHHPEVTVMFIKPQNRHTVAGSSAALDLFRRL
jgi:hypothetical protein